MGKHNKSCNGQIDHVSYNADFQLPLKKKWEKKFENKNKITKPFKNKVDVFWRMTDELSTS